VTDLTTLPPGVTARVRAISADLEPAVALRLRSLGLRPGAAVTGLRRAPLGSPWLVRVGGADLCLRRPEATSVLVEPDLA
jgi:Fe2+ transport system protein FeoA